MEERSELEEKQNNKFSVFMGYREGISEKAFF